MILDNIKNKFTTLLAVRVIAFLVLVIVAMGVWSMVQGYRLKEAKATLETEQLRTRMATGVANDNRTALKGVSEQLNACSIENVRVNVDGEKAMAKLIAEREKYASESAGWRKRYDDARRKRDCDEVLNKSFATCKGIKDY